MFWPDVVDCKDFYLGKLGVVTRRVLRERLRAWWPNTDGLVIVGVGYAAGVLKVLQGKGTELFALMPAGQGVLRWPREKANRACLVDEAELPLRDQSVNAVILLHVLEHSYAPIHLLQEAWRVLTPGGRLLVIVPNRSGLWARFDHTPLGQGRPFSRRQITQLLEEHRFSICRSQPLLFFPPTPRTWLLKYALMLERFGQCCLPWFGGVHCIEAQKQIPAIRGRAVPVRRAPALKVLGGLEPT